jgi:TolB-like protein
MTSCKPLFCVAFLAGLLFSFGFIPSGAQEAKLEAQKVIAVMPFANLARDTGLAWLGDGIAETMTTKLSQVPTWAVVERTRLDGVLKEIALGQSGVVDDSTAAKAGKMLGATTMVVGAFQKAGESVRLTARSVEVASGRVLKASEATGTMDEIFALEDRLAEDIVTAHGLALKPEQLQALQAKPTSDPAAYELANRAEMAVRAGNPKKAALLLGKAIAKDPNFAQAVFGLAKVEERMGHLRKARSLYLRYLDLAKTGHEPPFRVKAAKERSQAFGQGKDRP